MPPVESIRVRNAESSQSSLSEMQDAFQRAIMLGDDAVLNDLLDNSRTGRDVLFGVYRHAYVSRLVEVVRNDHPFLHRYLADQQFEELARSYIKACPSRSQNARWFSHRLPEFIAQAHPDATHIAELAALERALNDAFDAPDMPALAMADLAAIPVEEWSELILKPHPSARHLAFGTNAHALWLALKNGEPPPPVESYPVAQNVLAWREGPTPKVRRMPDEEAMMWNEAKNGVCFGALCELVAIYDDPETAPLRAAQHLQNWIASGLLAKPASA
jgi:hypothetical protein